jgi:hypothetical protein
MNGTGSGNYPVVRVVIGGVETTENKNTRNAEKVK